MNKIMTMMIVINLTKRHYMDSIRLYQSEKRNIRPTENKEK